jgi:hypothetical protein
MSSILGILLILAGLAAILAAYLGWQGRFPPSLPKALGESPRIVGAVGAGMVAVGLMLAGAAVSPSSSPPQGSPPERRGPLAKIPVIRWDQLEPVQLSADTSPEEAYAKLVEHFGQSKVVRVFVHDPEKKVPPEAVREKLGQVCANLKGTSVLVSKTDQGVVGVAGPMFVDFLMAKIILSTLAPTGMASFKAETHTVTIEVQPPAQPIAPVASQVQPVPVMPVRPPMTPQEEQEAARKEVRKAIEALRAPLFGSSGHDAAVKALETYLASPDKIVRADAVGALASWKNPADISRIIQMLDDDAEEVRLTAMAGLGRIEDDRAVVALVRCLNDPRQDISGAAHYLKNMWPYSESRVLEYLRHDGNTAKGEEWVCFLLSDVGGRSALSVLVSKYKSARAAKRHQVTVAASVAYRNILGRIGGVRDDDPDYDADVHFGR